MPAKGRSREPITTDSPVAVRRIWWNGAPLWSRHHNTAPSTTAVVSARGRLFYIVDEAPAGMDGSAPDRWSLVARDAFNGIVLWKRPMTGWGSAAWDADRWKWGKGDQLWSSPLTLPLRQRFSAG